jgi:allantoicase
MDDVVDVSFSGKDMGDGWETRRSRLPNHNDWAIIKLYVPNGI